MIGCGVKDPGNENSPHKCLGLRLGAGIDSIDDPYAERVSGERAFDEYGVGGGEFVNVVVKCDAIDLRRNVVLECKAVLKSNGERLENLI